MKASYIARFVFFSILLFLINIFVLSCNHHEKENNNFIYTSIFTKAEPTIDFKLIDCLNESNKKNIDISAIFFTQTKDAKTLQLILKIKKDHQKIDCELKKLVEKNLIIVPKVVYNLNLNSDSLKGKRVSLYLNNLLETEIINQIWILGQIEKTSQIIDFKIFAIKSKKTLQTNKDALKLH